MVAGRVFLGTSKMGRGQKRSRNGQVISSGESASTRRVPPESSGAPPVEGNVVLSGEALPGGLVIRMAGQNEKGWKIIEVDPSPTNIIIVCVDGKRIPLVRQKRRVLRVHVNPDKDGPDSWDGLWVKSPARFPRGSQQAIRARVELVEFTLSSGQTFTLLADAGLCVPSNDRPNEEESCDL